jgi:hypothetical protein
MGVTWHGLKLSTDLTDEELQQFNQPGVSVYGVQSGGCAVGHIPPLPLGLPVRAPDTFGLGRPQDHVIRKWSKHDTGGETAAAESTAAEEYRKKDAEESDDDVEDKNDEGMALYGECFELESTATDNAGGMAARWWTFDAHLVLKVTLRVFLVCVPYAF